MPFRSDADLLSYTGSKPSTGIVLGNPLRCLNYLQTVKLIGRYSCPDHEDPNSAFVQTKRMRALLSRERESRDKCSQLYSCANDIVIVRQDAKMSINEGEDPYL